MASSSSFNLENTSAAAALGLDRICRPGLRKALEIASRLVFILALSLFLFGFLTETFSLGQLRFFLGLTLLAFALAVKMFLFGLFRAFLLERTQGASFEVFRALEEARVFAKRKKLPEISSHVLCLVLLEQNPSFGFVLLRLLLDKKSMVSQLRNAVALLPRIPAKTPEIPYEKDMEKIFEEAMSHAKKQNRNMTHGMLLAAASRQNPVLKDILLRTNLGPEDLFHLVAWQERLEENLKKQKRFWLKENLQMRGTLGRDWASAYTATLDRFIINLTEAVRKFGFPRVIGHEKEMKAIERTLTRQGRHNVLLIGEPGSGKKNMIWDLASAMQLGQTTSEIAYFKLLELNLQELVAQAQSKEETETLLNRIFQEAANAGNVILFLDDVQNFVPNYGDETPGLLNIKGVLAPFLTMPEFRFVAATTFGGLHLTLEQDPSFLSFFESIEVQEISQEQTLEVLELRVGMIEYRSRCLIPYPALKEVVRLADKYIQGTPFPKKAVDLLDEAVSYLLQTKERVLLPGHVAAVLTEKTQIPVGKIETKERETLLNLEDLLHERIINQEEAVTEVSSALRRARTEIASRKGPMGSFLFLGPTGVGKTETAKALAAVYFGSESRMVRLDMSEFQNAKDIDRLLGSKDQEGLLTTPIRENPFCLVLLDELEKANANILNLFLQVLDEGHVTDGLGRKVSFMHTIIIATSNAGYQFILEAIKQKEDFKHLKQRMIDHLFSQGMYRPEFLNRFDGVIIFTPLTKENLKDIAQLMLSKVGENLEKKGIQFVITDPLKEKIAELGYDPMFGARSMRRVIQEKVENALAEALLRNDVRSGSTIEINPQDFTLKIS